MPGIAPKHAARPPSKSDSSLRTGATVPRQGASVVSQPVVVLGPEGDQDQTPGGSQRVFRLDQDMIVTIDGPAASGKTATAEALAKSLGLHVLSTGAMYRCATAIAIEHDIAKHHVFRLLEVVRKAHIHFDWHETRTPEIMAFGKSYAHRISDEDVTARVSEMSEIIPLRELMVGMQRDIAKSHRRLVSEGRDQGSVVFPEAPVKFYLFASARVRAERRRAQLLEKKGIDRDVTELEREIAARDENDRKKAYGALVKPDDALEVDSSVHTLDEVVTLMRNFVLERAKK